MHGVSMSDNIEVRVARAGDFGALDALFARSYPKLLKTDYAPSVLVLALPLISRAQSALVTSGTYYVAEIEGGIVGAGGWTPAPRAGVGDVRHVVTDDRFTRRGVGRALFQRIFSEAGVAGITTLDCKSTRTAVPFYQAVGFTVLGPIDIELRPGILFPAIQMQRDL